MPQSETDPYLRSSSVTHCVPLCDFASLSKPQFFYL